MKRKFMFGAIPILALAGLSVYLYGGGRVPAGQPPLQDLTPANLSVMRHEFNAAKDETRVLLLLSPTCSVCLRGASAADDVFARFTGKPIRVFVIWEPVLITDWARPSTATLRRVSDLRASQYWDSERLISHSMGEQDRRSVVWDYVAVYSPGTLWGDQPPKPSYQGGPVFRVTDAVATAFAEVRHQVAQQQ